MDFEKIKVDIYDILAILIPGMGILAIVAFSSIGWSEFASALNRLKGPMITGLLFGSFAIGHLVQEMADWGINKIKSPRFSKRWRDEIWASSDGEILKKAIAEDGGSISSADAAFDFCLSKVRKIFEKREVFVATADFSRAMLTIGALSSIAVGRFVNDRYSTFGHALLLVAAGALIIAIWLALFWRRMLRYREYSEKPVFYAYLAQRRDKHPAEKVVGGVS